MEYIFLASVARPLAAKMVGRPSLLLDELQEIKIRDKPV
ncbi:hypothetical protein IAQ61_009053, partial [Plenodomus lingam]